MSPQRASSTLVVFLIAMLAAACQGPARPAAVAAAPMAALAPLPEGGGCGPSIARTQAVVDSDVATGNLNAPVGARFGADLGRAAEACRGGRDREALGLLASAKARYGYH